MADKESRIFEGAIDQKLNSIANIPSAISDLIFGDESIFLLTIKSKYFLISGLKSPPSPEEELASFLRLCQAALVVAIITAAVASVSLVCLCIIRCQTITRG